MKFYIHTFGCQMNVNDSEHIAGMLKASGMQPALYPEKSSLIIINTCAVREKSEEKLYSLLGRYGSIKKNRKVIIGIVGCVAQLHRSKLWDRKPFLDFIIGPDNYWQIPQIISSKWKEKTIATHWSRKWHELPHQQILRASQVTSYITIMEGCNNFCTYCVVPYTRGREKYRPMDNILEEAKDLAGKGYKEIQLLGQNVNTYTDPISGKDFPSLLEEVSQIEGIEWIRFITSHPKNFTEKLAKTMKRTKKVCRQLHLPIQSGSTKILQQMNRGYTREDYMKRVNILQKHMPDIHLSTDIIVGFPGETHQEFLETLSLLEAVRFTNIFSFRYSPRPLTSASKKPETVPFDEKKIRLIQVQSLQKRLQLETNKTFIGQTQKVLCLGRSKKDPGIFSGRNEGNQVVNFTSKKNAIGKFVKIRITSCGPYSLIGQTV